MVCRWSALVASATDAGVTFAVLLLASQLGSRISQNTQTIVTRFMGLIVTAMGLQFVLLLPTGNLIGSDAASSRYNKLTSGSHNGKRQCKQIASVSIPILTCGDE